MPCRYLIFTQSIFLLRDILLDVLSDSKFCWEPGQVLIINPSSELILVSLTERTDVKWKTTEKENGKNFAFKTRWILDSPQVQDLQKQNASTNDHRSSQIILQLSPFGGWHVSLTQKHTSTPMKHQVLRPVSALAYTAACSFDCHLRKVCPLRFISFQDPKFLSQKRSRESSIHQLLTHSEIIGWVLYDITSLTKTNPSQGPKHNKKSKKSKKKSRKNKHQSQKCLKCLRFFLCLLGSR